MELPSGRIGTLCSSGTEFLMNASGCSEATWIFKKKYFDDSIRIFVSGATVIKSLRYSPASLSEYGKAQVEFLSILTVSYMNALRTSTVAQDARILLVRPPEKGHE